MYPKRHPFFLLAAGLGACTIHTTEAERDEGTDSAVELPEQSAGDTSDKDGGTSDASPVKTSDASTEIDAASDTVDKADGATPGSMDGGSSSTSSGAKLGALVSACASPAPSLTSACVTDPLEPSTADTSLDVSLTDGCYAVGASLSNGADHDSLRFTALRHDPVQVKLKHTVPGTSPLNLQFAVLDVSKAAKVSAYDPRSGASEESSAHFIADANAPYIVHAYANGTSNDCHPYELYVDTAFCTDALEDNDTPAQATQLDLKAHARFDIAGNLFTGDDDFFGFTVQHHDPVLVEGKYSAAANDTLNANLEIINAAGQAVSTDYAQRTTLTETVRTWLLPAAASDVFHARLYASGTGCVPYALTVDSDACTDAHEDDDDFSAAKALPAGDMLSARIFHGDDDFVDLAGKTFSNCTLSFSRESGSTQVLRMAAFDAEQRSLKDVATSAAAEAHADLPLPKGTRYLRVQASQAGHCDSYTLTCTP